MFLHIIAAMVATVAIVAIAIQGRDIMSEALKASVDALVAEVAESNGKLESVRVFLVGLPDLVAAAVADALEAANVEAAEAAIQIDAARNEISSKVDAVEAAISANPAPGE